MQLHELFELVAEKGEALASRHLPNLWKEVGSRQIVMREKYAAGTVGRDGTGIGRDFQDETADLIARTVKLVEEQGCDARTLSRVLEVRTRFRAPLAAARPPGHRL
eukprot:3061262-Prymnesium_polylepis.1